MGGLCSKEPEDEPLPPMVVDAKCATGAEVSADGLRITGEPSGIFMGVAMSVVFGNDKAYFEARVSKLGPEGEKVGGLTAGAGVRVGLGKRDAAVATFQKEKMVGEVSGASAWTVSAADADIDDAGAVIGVAYEGESFPGTDKTVSFASTAV
jgi:hypothetical protein